MVCRSRRRRSREGDPRLNQTRIRQFVEREVRGRGRSGISNRLWSGLPHLFRSRRRQLRNSTDRRHKKNANSAISTRHMIIGATTSGARAFIGEGKRNGTKQEFQGSGSAPY